jgi:hypothetical protein
MTDAPPIITNEDAAIDSAFFGSHAGRTCYARAHHSGWVLLVRQIVAQREPPVMLRVWDRLERVPDNDANCLALLKADAHRVALRADRLGQPRFGCRWMHTHKSCRPCGNTAFRRRWKCRGSFRAGNLVLRDSSMP